MKIIHHVFVIRNKQTRPTDKQTSSTSTAWLEMRFFPKFKQKNSEIKVNDYEKIRRVRDFLAQYVC